MRRLLFLTAAGLAVVALAGAVGLPDVAGAQSTDDGAETLTVSGVGTVAAVPNEAQMSFGVDTRGETARAAVSANADAARRVINALRHAGARELQTQYVSVYPVTGENGRIDGYSASNSVSAVSDVDEAPALVDAAVGAGANQVSGPSMSSSNAEELYRQALAKAVDEARARAQVLARAAGRAVGEIVSISEAASASPLPYAERAALDSATPIVPGEQDTTATISVTFSLR